jgi:hypothetical protein
MDDEREQLTRLDSPDCGFGQARSMKRQRARDTARAKVLGAQLP